MKRINYILSIVSLGIFLFIRFNYNKGPLEEFDQVISNRLAGNDIFIPFHIFGSTTIGMSIGCILIFYLWIKERDYRDIIFVILTIGGGKLLNKLVKEWVERPRPQVADQLSSYSFPSSHAMLALLFLFTMAYFITKLLDLKKLSLILWGLAVLITILTGLSRVVENQHYASDIIAGWALGYGWFVLCYFLCFNKKEKIQSNTS